MKEASRRFAMHLILCIGLVALPASYAVRFRASAQEVHQMDIDELQQRGKKLRDALQETYQKLVDERALIPGRGAEVTDVVERFIPVGTSFSDAETILKDAEFRVDERSASALPRSGAQGVHAEIHRFAEQFPAVTDLIVILYQKSPSDYTTVAKISATFFISLP